MARSCTSDSMSSGAAVVAGRRTEPEMKRCHTAAPLDLLSLQGSLAAKAPGAAVVDFLVAPGVPAGRGGAEAADLRVGRLCWIVSSPLVSSGYGTSSWMMRPASS